MRKFPIPITLLALFFLLFGAVGLWSVAWVLRLPDQELLVRPIWFYALMALTGIGTFIGLWNLRVWAFYFYGATWALGALLPLAFGYSFDARGLFGLTLMSIFFILYRKKFISASDRNANQSRSFKDFMHENKKRISYSLLFGLIIAVGGWDFYSISYGGYLGTGWVASIFGYMATPGTLVSVLVTADQNVLSVTTICVVAFLFWSVAAYTVSTRFFGRF